jgi:hypothetical protein
MDASVPPAGAKKSSASPQLSPRLAIKSTLDPPTPRGLRQTSPSELNRRRHRAAAASPFARGLTVARGPRVSGSPPKKGPSGNEVEASSRAPAAQQPPAAAPDHTSDGDELLLPPRLTPGSGSTPAAAAQRLSPGVSSRNHAQGRQRVLPEPICSVSSVNSSAASWKDWLDPSPLAATSPPSAPPCARPSPHDTSDMSICSVASTAPSPLTRPPLARRSPDAVGAPSPPRREDRAAETARALKVFSAAFDAWQKHCAHGRREQLAAAAAIAEEEEARAYYSKMSAFNQTHSVYMRPYLTGRRAHWAR